MQIELIKPHSHAGRELASGAVLTLDESQTTWLIELGVAKRASPKPENNKTPLKPELINLEEKSQ
jgi:hypothetical protein